jgi:GNAT superfamily N-acetyltransferase
MNITERNSLTTLGLPLPLYKSIVIADAEHEGEQFFIALGLDRKLTADVKTRSLDREDRDIQEQTSDRKRFGEGSYEKWYAKDRTPIALVAEGGTLAALLWFGPESFGEVGPWHTVAYRSYAPYRGKGIMKAFARFAIAKYKALRPEVKLWAAIHSGNAASIALAEKLGFKRVGDATAETAQIVMVQRREV